MEVRKGAHAMPEQILQMSMLKANNHASIKMIMVVEDDEPIGEFIVEVIHQETNHFAIHHATPQEALEWASWHAPHLFILDFGLPGMNGLELYDRLHGFGHLKHARSILISAVSPPAAELKKRDMIFLAKPFNVLKLVELIERVLT